jgi:hypothetical protein
MLRELNVNALKVKVFARYILEPIHIVINVD